MFIKNPILFELILRSYIRHRPTRNRAESRLHEESQAPQLYPLPEFFYDKFPDEVKMNFSWTAVAIRLTSVQEADEPCPSLLSLPDETWGSFVQVKNFLRGRKLLLNHIPPDVLSVPKTMSLLTPKHRSSSNFVLVYMCMYATIEIKKDKEKTHIRIRICIYTKKSYKKNIRYHRYFFNFYLIK